MQHSKVIYHEVAPTFAVVDFVHEMTAKKSCKYSEYVSFEHLNTCSSCFSAEIKFVSAED